MAEAAPPPETRIELDREVLKDFVLTKNISQEFLLTTVDKAKLCLLEHQAHLQNKNAWVAPLAVFLPVLTTVVAADFRDAFGLKAAVWQALYLLGVMLSGVWLLFGVIGAWKARKHGSVDGLVAKLKQGR